MLATFAFWLLGLSRSQKRFIQALFDAVCAALALILVVGVLPFASLAGAALWATTPALPWSTIAVLTAVSATATVAAAQLLGLYRAVVRYAGIRVLQAVFFACVLAALLTWAASAALGHPLPFLTILAVAGLTTVFMAAGRLVLREVFYLLRKADKPNVILYGAGDAGRQLLTSFAQSASHRVVAMLDDAPELQGTEVHGVRIYPPLALASLKERFQVQAVILAAPSMPRERKNQILQQLEPLGLPLKSLPSVSDILSGRKSVSDLQQVSIEDVLGRDPVTPNLELMRKKVAGRCVMVTGGGGSIGKELCLQIAALGPTRLIVLDSSEFALYTVTTELHDRLRAQAAAGQPCPDTVPVLQSVLDEPALLACLQAHGVQTVFHAAAFKHVPLVEANPFTGLQNNVFGTWAALRASEAAGVQDFLLISTDKAVRPTNIMGASKRLAELIAQARAQQRSERSERSAMCIAMVRFGNVLSSSGSVIPRFKDQIAAGGPVTVTHPDITRFFMTIPEAVELVLQASGLAKGGEVFLLEMGEPVRIVGLAKRMIRLSGYRPVLQEPAGLGSKPTAELGLGLSGSKGVGAWNAAGAGAAGSTHDMPIVFSGLRPGEKLYEELLIEADAQPTEHPKIFMAHEFCLDWPQLEPLLGQLQRAIATSDLAWVKRLLQELKVGYTGESSAATTPVVLSEGEGSLRGANTPTPETGYRGASKPIASSTLLAAPSTSSIDADKPVASDTPSSAGPAEALNEKKINPFLSKLLHVYFLLRRPMTLGVRAIVVNDKQEVMLVRHRYEPGWQLPGGGVESGESPLEALRRELMEEVSLRITKVDRFLGVFFNSEVSRRDHVMVYLVSSFQECRRLEASHEIGEHGFFPLNNLPPETTAGTRRRLAEAFGQNAISHVW
jgi:FlaA1/EpsC-like NDP-sugar epimerase/8-oxo-dGTP pyrophosphatase MutT (NUDIX family)